ncbi:MAG: flagellar basal body rod protein FlgB [Sulfuricurvum sp.]|uniref:flagellar basal body rod protein FlgB n=1 Tax=Sulfuricurvum sp. TaxID=2025608 RepID=UPI0026080E06|nr:flagellar basal body rod protein FlgB [Sulfuricurvum sp.]MDD2830081.1 flagellar basal body rod protein FlgB [Sulfuricurvum sp.]MDD4948196.1 flagellar basal body rod protein FlgB [Sulfuricurvum sp.]
MGLNISRSHDLMQSAMDYRAARQDMIASNIANADTPNYRPRDIRFEEALAQKSAELFTDKTNTLAMTQTSSAHMSGFNDTTNSTNATTFFRDGHMARNDGNSVDLDVESSEMAKNATMFNALTAAIKKDSTIFKSVIDASSKTS